MIYDAFFGFREEPFGVTPNPKFLYLSKNHEDALAHLNFGMSESKGFIMLTGEVGSGKTTLIRYLLDNLGADTHTSLIINPMIAPLDILKLINHDFGVTCSGNTQKEQLDALNSFLLKAFSKNEKAVLVIDEAQELSVECLEFIRLLSNLETNTKKLLQVILVGQPQLKKIVASAPLKQLDQRIAVRYHLEPLDFNDAIIYIGHRLKIAGGGMTVFPVKGIRLIYKYSRGIPRLINLTCDRTLLLSYSEGKIKINTAIVRKAIKDLGHSSGKGEKEGLLRPALLGLAILSLVIVVTYNNVSHEENYLEKIRSMFKSIKTDGDFFINDGIYLSSKEDLSEAACVLNLLTVWGEKDLRGSSNMSEEAEKRGYSIHNIGNNLGAATKFNMPCILHMKQGKTSRCMVLRWLVGNDAMIIDPKEGKNIVPASKFKNSIAEINLLYKNRYNNSDKITLVQKELKKRGLYNYPVTGTLSAKTKKALTDFQETEGLKKTGILDNETAIMLSNVEGIPKLTPE